MRYLPLSDGDRAEMLAAVGAPDVQALFADVPAAARLDGPVPGLDRHRSEIEVERHLGALARRNTAAGDVPFFLGAGAYRHHVPASVDHLIQRGEFLTSYTPYQPEIAQGTLQVLFEFQTMVARLTGMEVANASMYDGSTACVEAVFMARRITRRAKALVSGGLHPHYAEVARTMCRVTGDRLEFGPGEPTPGRPGDDLAWLIDRIDDETSCVVVQTPNVFGHLHDLSELAEAAHAKGALVVAVVTEVVSLGALQPPGAMGADIVVAEGQGLGNALSFGGPYLGLFACRERHVRQMPGRLAGQTIDAQGRRGFVLTLATREQHIRREKATSNICTNSGLCALAFTIHLSLLGGEGLARLARLNHARAFQAAEALAAVPGVELLNATFFNEFAIRVGGDTRAAMRAMAEMGVLGGVAGGRLWPDVPEMAGVALVAATETVTDEDVRKLARAWDHALREKRP